MPQFTQWQVTSRAPAFTGRMAGSLQQVSLPQPRWCRDVDQGFARAPRGRLQAGNWGLFMVRVAICVPNPVDGRSPVSIDIPLQQGTARVP
jgi:hypothetical protein